MTFEADKPQDIREAIASVYSEMDYQMVRWLEEMTGRHPHDRSLDEWVAYMLDYVLEALHQTTRGNEKDAVDTVRKFTTMGMVALAQNGAPHRVMPSEEEFQKIYAEYRRAAQSTFGRG